MVQFIARRIILAVITLFVIATLTFFLMQLIPGGPFNTEQANPKAVEAMMKKYGLDRPVSEQYVIYMGNLVKGDLGDSYKRKGSTVNGIIAEKFPTSAKVGATSLIFAVAVGVPLGALSALRRNGVLDRALMFFCTLGIAVPSFVVGTVLLYLLGYRLGWLPMTELKTPLHYIMPGFALALYPICFISRLMRSNMLNVLGQDYIKTARAKGMPEYIVLFKHALRNSIIPVITYLGPLTAGILTGGFVIEKIFSIPGLGRFFVESITARDYPLVMGVTIFYAALLIICTFFVDIIYGLIDPRIKFE